MLTEASYHTAIYAYTGSALLVVVFQIFTDGADSAMHALRPLAAMLGLALVLTLLLRFTLLRGSSKPAREQASDNPDTASSA